MHVRARRTPARWVALAAVSLSGLFAPTETLFAQFTPPARDMSTADAPLPSDSVAIARDRDAGLGWLLPDAWNVARYRTPKMCRQLVAMVEHDTRGWTGWDTVATGSKGDTLGTSAQTVGRQCVTQFTVATVESRELVDLIELALSLQNVPLATAAVDRRIHEAKTPHEQGRALLDAVIAFRSAHPSQMRTAESFLGRFDALSSNAPWWKLLARSTLIPFGPDTIDTARVGRLYRDNLAAYQTLPMKARTFLADHTGGDVYVADVIDGLNGVPLAERCNHLADAYLAWPQLAQTDNAAELKDTVDGWDATSRRFAEKFVRRPCLADTVPDRQKMPQWPAGTWYAPGSITPAGAPIVPTPGHVTWVVDATLGNGRIDPQLAQVRRVYDKYHSAGLDVFLVVRTEARSVWASPPLTPAQVATVTAWYFHDYLQLPMPLLVVQSPDAIGYVHWFSPVYDRHGNAIQQFTAGDLIMETFIRQALGLPIQ